MCGLFLLLLFVVKYNKFRYVQSGFNLIWGNILKNKWTREETIVAFYVYCIIPFSSSSKTNPEIIKYAKLIKRTPSALNMKIRNIGRLDPELSKKNITGLTHGAKLEKIIWDEFINNREQLIVEANKILSKFSNESYEEKFLLEFERKYANTEKDRLIKTRLNQEFFRLAALAAYNDKCAITGMKLKNFLVASHIVPWSKDKENRLNPHNGICLNSIHDKAFDKGYLTINNDYKVVISKRIKEEYSNDFICNVFKTYEGKKIFKPEKFCPLKKFLEYHQDMIFLGA